MFSKVERFIYSLKRHLVAVVLFAIGVQWLIFKDNDVWIDDNTHNVIANLVNAALALSAILLVTKFVFPKLNIQEKVNEGNIAVAILAGSVILAVASLFK